MTHGASFWRKHGALFPSQAINREMAEVGETFETFPAVFCFILDVSHQSSDADRVELVWLIM